MFGINSNGDISTGDAPTGAPMVPNGDGIDQPAQAPPATDPPVDAPSAPPMPDGPAGPPSLPVDPQPATDTSTAPALPTGASDDLINLKQQALQNLAPLVGHLDQTPEEKFKTTMMMLQASDNAELVKDAYAAANAITD